MWRIKFRFMKDKLGQTLNLINLDILEKLRFIKYFILSVMVFSTKTQKVDKTGR